MLPAARTDIPDACNNIMVESPQTTQAPDRRSKRRIKDQPLTPALSARHASPDMPPTRDSTITIQIGISISACCSFVIALPHKRKNPAQGPGLVWWCVPLLAVAPIEDDYFLQVDSGGSKRVLMPPVNKWVRRVNAPRMSGNTSPRLTLLGPVCPAPLFTFEVGQGRAPKSKAVPHCPTSFTFSSYIERLLRTRMRVKRAYCCPLRSHVRGALTGGTVGQPSNGAGCARPTAVESSGTRWAIDNGWAKGEASITQLFSRAAVQQYTHELRAAARSRFSGSTRSE